MTPRPWKRYNGDVQISQTNGRGFLKAHDYKYTDSCVDYFNAFGTPVCEHLVHWYSPFELKIVSKVLKSSSSVNENQRVNEHQRCPPIELTSPDENRTSPYSSALVFVYPQYHDGSIIDTWRFYPDLTVPEFTWWYILQTVHSHLDRKADPAS